MQSINQSMVRRKGHFQVLTSILFHLHIQFLFPMPSLLSAHSKDGESAQSLQKDHRHHSDQQEDDCHSFHRPRPSL